MRVLRRRMALSHRFTVVFSLVVLLVVGLLAALAEGYMSRTLRGQTELRARSLALSLAAVSRPFLLHYDHLTLQQIADATLEEPDLAYVVILDKEGKVAGFSGHRELQGRQLTGLSNLRALNAEAPTVQEADWRRDAQEDARPERVLEAMAPVRFGHDDAVRWGTVRVGLSLQPVQREMLIARFVLLLAAAAGIVGAVYASHVLAARVARPLARLVEATNRLERGDWDPEFSIRTGDEIEELATRFASAAQSLDRQKRELLAAKEELTALNATLEEKVQRRTAELAASREKYRLLVEGSPDAFLLLEQDRMAFTNAAFLNIFEYPQGSSVLENLRWTQIIHPDYHRVAGDHFRRAEEELSEFRVDMVGQTRSGRTVELEVRGRGVRYRGGPAVELVLADVGEKRRLVRQVVQSERLRAMGEMTAMVAHNFNNLLAVILGRTQLLLRQVPGEAAQRSLEVVQSSAQRAGEMVRQLQEYFGSEVDLRFTDIDLNAVVRDVAVYLEALWRTTRAPGEPSITVKLELGPVPHLLGAEPLLRDVFHRILTNAAEAMPSGGQILVQTASDGRLVAVRVEDPGTGMTPEVQRRAFDPFFSTKGSRTRGLGLAASFGIVQRHHGRIELHSSPGEGTRVEILFPVQNRRVLPLPGSDDGLEPAAAAVQGEHRQTAGETGQAQDPDEARQAQA